MIPIEGTVFCDSIKPSMKQILAVLFLLLFLSSCSRGITTFEAANGKAKCGRYIK